MNKMVPLQIGIAITDSKFLDYNNHIVMRTSRSCDHEVFDLTRPSPDRCWDYKCSVDIEPARNSKFLLEMDSEGVVVSCTKQN